MSLAPKTPVGLSNPQRALAETQTKLPLLFGRPNIDGAFEAAYYTEQLKVRKAFHRGMDLNGHALSGTDRSSISMEFNAEDSNPIYSPECDTVQPKSLRFLCLIRFQ